MIVAEATGFKSRFFRKHRRQVLSRRGPSIVVARLEYSDVVCRGVPLYKLIRQNQWTKSVFFIFLTVNEFRH